MTKLFLSSQSDKDIALRLSAADGNVKQVQDCIDAGAKVNASDNSIGTALHYAAMHGHVETVRVLLDNGAEINATDSEGKTALEIAKEKGRDEIVKYLKASRRSSGR